MKALLKNYHQSPRKVRLVANLIRGKSVPQARALLAFQPQKSSPAILKLLDSAAANARNTGATPENLFVKAIAVNKGLILKRFKPMGRGRAAQFHRTMSIVTLELGATQAAAKKVAKKAAKKAVKKTAAKKVAAKAE